MHGHTNTVQTEILLRYCIIVAPNYGAHTII